MKSTGYFVFDHDLVIRHDAITHIFAAGEDVVFLTEELTAVVNCRSEEEASEKARLAINDLLESQGFDKVYPTPDTTEGEV